MDGNPFTKEDLEPRKPPFVKPVAREWERAAVRSCVPRLKGKTIGKRYPLKPRGYNSNGGAHMKLVIDPGTSRPVWTVPAIWEKAGAEEDPAKRRLLSLPRLREPQAVWKGNVDVDTDERREYTIGLDVFPKSQTSPAMAALDPRGKTNVDPSNNTIGASLKSQVTEKPPTTVAAGSSAEINVGPSALETFRQFEEKWENGGYVNWSRVPYDDEEDMDTIEPDSGPTIFQEPEPHPDTELLTQFLERMRAGKATTATEDENRKRKIPQQHPEPPRTPLAGLDTNFPSPQRASVTVTVNATAGVGGGELMRTSSHDGNNGTSRAGERNETSRRFPSTGNPSPDIRQPGTPAPETANPSSDIRQPETPAPSTGSAISAPAIKPGATPKILSRKRTELVTLTKSNTILNKGIKRTTDEIDNLNQRLANSPPLPMESPKGRRILWDQQLTYYKELDYYSDDDTTEGLSGKRRKAPLRRTTRSTRRDFPTPETASGTKLEHGLEMDIVSNSQPAKGGAEAQMATGTGAMLGSTTECEFRAGVESSSNPEVTTGNDVIRLEVKGDTAKSTRRPKVRYVSSSELELISNKRRKPGPKRKAESDREATTETEEMGGAERAEEPVKPVPPSRIPSRRGISNTPLRKSGALGSAVGQRRSQRNKEPAQLRQ